MMHHKSVHRNFLCWIGRGVGVLCHGFLTERSPKIASDGPVGFVSELGEGNESDKYSGILI